MSTAETSSIDEKKNVSEQKLDFKGFFKNYISSIVLTIGFSIFVMGTLGLYTTKVAQANILPDNIDLAPYTIFDRIIERDIPIDMNIMRENFLSENKDTFSQKAIFNSQEYLDSFQNSFLCSLKASAAKSNVALYLSPVYDGIISKVFYAINSIFFYLSFLPESIIMVIYGMMYSLIWMLIFFYVLACSVYYHYANVHQIFRYKVEPPGLDATPDNPNIISMKIIDKVYDKTQWESEDNIDIFRFWRFIIAIISCFTVIPISAYVSAIVFTVYGFLAPFYTTYKIHKTDKTDKSNKVEGVFDFIKNTFKYKKQLFFILASISLFSNGVNYFGNTAAFSIGVSILVAWFMGLYVNQIPEPGLDNFTSKIRQNPIQSKVLSLDKTKLLDLCGWIPMVDKKRDEILKKGTIRKVNKVGGNEIETTSKKVSFNKNVEILTPPPIIKKTSKEMTNSAPLEDLTNSEPLKDISNPEINTNPEPLKNMTNPEPLKNMTNPEPLKNMTNPEINTNPEPLKDISNPEPLKDMTGGKKLKVKKGYNKKYNIKFT